MSGARRDAPLQAASSPHVHSDGPSHRRLLADVLVALAPVGAAAVWFFRWEAVRQVAVACLTAVLVEAGCARLRRRPSTLGDGSACITGLILAFSLPPALPSHATAIGAAVAIALGKMVFGGLGQNVFNPAMVGRAFLAASFPALMGSWSEPYTLHAVTGATPLASARSGGEVPGAWPLLVGATGGCVGETSAAAIVAGGAWLLWRRAADWRPTAGMLLAVAAIAAAESLWKGPGPALGVAGHLTSGAVLLGAFFIVTDPVTCPLTSTGRWTFGAGVGSLTMVIRLFGGYPEGVMYAVLVFNGLTPLLERATKPIPIGGAR